jgi:hypothetical protein
MIEGSSVLDDNNGMRGLLRMKSKTNNEEKDRYLKRNGYHLNLKAKMGSIKKVMEEDKNKSKIIIDIEKDKDLNDYSYLLFDEKDDNCSDINDIVHSFGIRNEDAANTDVCVVEKCAVYSNESCLEHTENKCIPTEWGCRYVFLFITFLVIISIVFFFSSLFYIHLIEWVDVEIILMLGTAWSFVLKLLIVLYCKE